MLIKRLGIGSISAYKEGPAGIGRALRYIGFWLKVLECEQWLELSICEYSESRPLQAALFVVIKWVEAQRLLLKGEYEVNVLSNGNVAFFSRRGRA